MHINIKNQICNYSNKLSKLEKLETKSILIDKKEAIRIWLFILLC